MKVISDRTSNSTTARILTQDEIPGKCHRARVTGHATTARFVPIVSSIDLKVLDVLRKGITAKAFKFGKALQTSMIS